ncbi:MAG TPA: DUF3311 domain-containing protein [Streptosporangiaceae bacterium]|jgi:hypothetical protein|nr:DUF3311 domain-containing protein [Streptosporangiaceae bacterium]
MAHPSPPRRRTGAWIAAAILLVIAVAGALITPIYDRATPKLGSFPFFYWYQLIWVPVVAILSWMAYLLTTPRRQPGQAPPPAATAAGTSPGGSGEAR